MRPNQVFPSKYLKADSDDIPEEGSVPVTINGLRMETLKTDDGDDEEKPVLYFDEFPKGLVLNKTNWGIIGDILGSDDSDDWTGHQVHLYSADVQFGNKMMRGIRVKKVRPQKPAQRQAPVSAGSVPYDSRASQARPSRTTAPAPRRPDPGAPPPGQGEADEDSIPF
jgi:hypothetical protein